jgi:hypothetical protein
MVNFLRTRVNWQPRTKHNFIADQEPPAEGARRNQRNYNQNALNPFFVVTQHSALGTLHFFSHISGDFSISA